LLLQVKVGAPFYNQAWHGLKYGSSNMGLLVSLGTTAAFAYSLTTMLLCALDANYMGHVYFESSVLILVFVCLGKYLEAMAKARTSDAVRSLMQLAPKTAELVVFGGPDGRSEKVQQIDTRLVQVRRVCVCVGGGVVVYQSWPQCVLCAAPP
jgi:Cu+-exporting ATPase